VDLATGIRLAYADFLARFPTAAAPLAKPQNS
jgi:hypothetical protein